MEDAAKKSLLFVSIWLFIFSTSYAANPKIVVLANSIDSQLAVESNLFQFLENEGFSVVLTSADDFEFHKNQRFIVILGGPDAPEGVGDIVRGSEILSIGDADFIRESGNNQKFVGTNPWGRLEEQVVWIFAGSDREQTKNIHISLRNSLVREVEIEIAQTKSILVEPVDPCPPSKTNPISHYAQYKSEENRGDVYICQVVYTGGPANWSITLYNQVGQDVNLANYRLSDRVSGFYFIAKTDTLHPDRVELIHAKDYWMVNASVFNPQAITGPYTSSGLYLSHKSGTLQLMNRDDRILDVVTWSHVQAVPAE
jgi:hypothetical protein